MSDNDKYITLTDDNFDSVVIASSVPVLVDFWAPWCGPCRLMGKEIEQLATDFAGKAVVGKLNIDNYDRVAKQYHIEAIPALLFFKDGEVVDRQSGVVPKQELANKLNNLLDQNNLPENEAA